MIREVRIPQFMRARTDEWVFLYIMYYVGLFTFATGINVGDSFSGFRGVFGGMIWRMMGMSFGGFFWGLKLMVRGRES